MGIASGSTPACSPSTNSSSSEEPEFTFPPTIARSLSYRTPRNNAHAQYPFPPVVATESALHRTSSQATVVQSYGEQQYTTTTMDRRSSLVTIRQSMAYLQAFEDPPHPPVNGNWTSSLATITAVSTQTAGTQTSPLHSATEETSQQAIPTFSRRGLSVSTIVPTTVRTASASPSAESSQNPSLSRESSQSARTSTSIYSIPESIPVRPTGNGAPSQAAVRPGLLKPLPEPPAPPAVIESQITITPASLQSSPEAQQLPAPNSPSVPASTPDELHPPQLHFPQNAHHHHHHAKTSVHNTDTSTCSWSVHSQEPDPRYDRLVFDYRVMAQSMHAYRQISIFRRFGRLSMANLLYYQDELAGIERALANVDREETRWTHTGISESESEKHELRETRIKLMKMLRETLKNYYEALLLQEQIFTSLDPPRPVDSRLLAALEDPSAPPGDSSPFSGAENSDDLVALGLGGRDSLEKLVGRIIPAIFPHRDPSVEDLRHRNLSQKDIASILSPFTRRITRLIIAIATAALMLGPMVILQFLASETWKLVCISVFTIVLALLVALATRGRGEAIVMVIAAYAAVLVVFVQGGQVYCAGGDSCPAGG